MSVIKEKTMKKKITRKGNSYYENHRDFKLAFVL